MYIPTLVRRSVQIAADVVVDGVLPVVVSSERFVVGVIRQHLADLDATAESATDPSAEVPALPAPTDVLQSLLDRAIYNLPEDSAADLHRALLTSMVPDEARILAALSDESAYPVVHIEGPGSGTSWVTVLENASTVGRIAGVSLPQHTPLYLSRLLHLGLIEIGPEGPASMERDYEMLLTDDAVSVAQTKARRGIRSPRVVRRTVAVSALGRQVWEAAK